ncbi:hypothetical protein DL770_006076 [Monosporascus sp. CRB-9-2]|nr:hypothetical protein DL770_006076 [Monosporascus sp. CRB-9-2]
MDSTSTPNDVQMGNAPPTEDEPKYGGYSRFELELEVMRRGLTLELENWHALGASNTLTSSQFVQALANPYYLNHLASQKLLNEPAFVAYLNYLQYWKRPPYLKYLTYPGPTLKHLELLQQEKFRQDIISPELVQLLVTEGVKASVDWHRED